MYLKDGVVYAGQPQQPVKVSGVRPMVVSNTSPSSKLPV